MTETKKTHGREIPVMDSQEEWVVVCPTCGFHERKVTHRPRFKCLTDQSKLIRFPVEGGVEPPEAKLMTLNLQMRQKSIELYRIKDELNTLNADRNILLNAMIDPKQSIQS